MHHLRIKINYLGNISRWSSSITSDIQNFNLNSESKELQVQKVQSTLADVKDFDGTHTLPASTKSEKESEILELISKISTTKQRKLSLETLTAAKNVMFRKSMSHSEGAGHYYFENGFRKVRPYHTNRYAFCKERWIGKSLLFMQEEEFPNFPLKKEIQKGNISINLQPVESEHAVLRQGDLLSTRIHFHEYPVLNDNIDVLYENKDLLVVNKPSSIPIHPTGGYCHNSLLSILKADRKRSRLYVCHRIDRLTSGVVIFAKTKKSLQKIANSFMRRKVEKEYICKVVGIFPSFPKTISCSQPLTYVNKSYCVPWRLKSIQAKEKEALTEFSLISTNETTSLVLCKPKTGRMHQIRAHLMYLGHPIVNDPVYNSPLWGPGRFKHGPFDIDLDKVAGHLSAIYHLHSNDKGGGFLTESSTQYHDPTEKEKLRGSLSSVKKRQSRNFHDSSTDNTERNIDRLYNCEDKTKRFNLEKENDSYYDEDCDRCNNPKPDLDKHLMTMYLHAYRYKIPSLKQFKAPLPKWASAVDVTCDEAL
ncbi:unnamed protein product [Clavelina lepadiformis]|uniref:Pseudouridine synthase RsuA/RluA-like domain-containing protein n=2 Tax=Clavelina lepadiformis TaxID=159417 RepID=A0ABP0FP58_CLALP